MLKSARKKVFSGFTLIELLIVIAILGILAAAVLVATNPAKRTNQARDAARKSDIGQIATSLQAYYTTPGLGKYPGPSGVGVAGGLTMLTVSGDLKQLPKDPKGNEYSYTVNIGSTEAAVYITLDDPTGSSGFWCWRSFTGAVTESVTSTGCTP